MIAYYSDQPRIWLHKLFSIHHWNSPSWRILKLAQRSIRLLLIAIPPLLSFKSVRHSTPTRHYQGPGCPAARRHGPSENQITSGRIKESDKVVQEEPSAYQWFGVMSPSCDALGGRGGPRKGFLIKNKNTLLFILILLILTYVFSNLRY